MLTQIKKYPFIKKGFKSRVFSVCRKTVAVSCVAGIVMITNTPLVFAYEAHTVNVTARIVNDIPGINPPGGEFCADGRLEVELSIALEGADIYYTINGNNPICGENSENFKYNDEPFELPAGVTTVKAVACHEELRNGHPVVMQSAIMMKEFDASVPSVIVTEPVDGAVWYCNPNNPNIYPIEWTIGNYRNADELSVDIVYITDNDNNGIISEGDNRFLIANNLTGTTGSYPFLLIKEYCYYGYGWAEVTVTESSTDPNTDNCKNSGISGRIFDPMVCDSCDASSASNISVATDVNVEPEPVVDEENIEDENTDDNNTDDTEEDIRNEDVDDSDADNEDVENESGESAVDENADDVDMNNEDNADDTEEDIRNEDVDDDEDDEEESDNGNEGSDEETIESDEDVVLEDDGIIMDREEDFDEEENDNDDENEDGEEENNNENVDSDVDDDDNDESIDDDSDDDNADNDDDSPDDAPIEEDDDSTEIEFNL
ncbi:MAG: FN3 associated domain-containing protein [Patescibacteria group bacterium]|nr:FN3 associated domain-containing protein [Patescibacteria group bacterium]